MESTQRRFARMSRIIIDLLLPLAFAAATLGLGLVGVRGPAAATLKLGPTTGRYLRGFAPLYEIESELATRWTTYDATASFPLRAAGGPVEIAYRFERVFGQTAVVEVRLGDRRIDRFECRGGGFQVRRPVADASRVTPLELRFITDSHEGRDRGLRLDWIRVNALRGTRLSLRGPALWIPALFLAWLWALLRIVGHSRRSASLLASIVFGAMVVFLMRDPFGFAHVSLSLGGPAMIIAALAAVLARVLRGGRWFMPILVAAYLIKGAGLFHPQSFYPDFQNAREFVRALSVAQGSLAARTVEAQIATNVAYPRTIAGRAHAFPYSPLFFLPFASITKEEAIEEAYRHAGLFLTFLEGLLVFILARIVACDARDEEAAGCLERVPILAVLISVILPPIFSRLLLAMAVTLAGHVLDVCLIAATLWYLKRGGSRPALPALFATLSVLTYVSSLFTVGAFLVAVAVLERRQAWRLLLVLFASTAVATAWLYHPFAIRFVTEILPAVFQGAAMNTESAAAPPPALQAFGRIPVFYGWAYPFFAIAGFLVARRRLSSSAVRVLAAYGIAFLMLVFLRAFGRGLFRDLKEITFAVPLVAVLTALTLTELLRRGRAGRFATACVLAGLTIFGLSKYRDYLKIYASVVLHVQAAPEARTLPPSG